MKEAKTSLLNTAKYIKQSLKRHPMYPEKGGLDISPKDEDEFNTQVKEFASNYNAQFLICELKKMICNEEYSAAIVLTQYILCKFKTLKDNQVLKTIFDTLEVATLRMSTFINETLIKLSEDHDDEILKE